MIKTKGYYSFSKDGGKTWLDFSNMLLTGYYNNNLQNGSMKAVIGRNQNPPQYTDVAFSTAITSDLETEMEEGRNIYYEEDYFIVQRYKEFNFGVGNNVTGAADVGLYIGSSLVSRSLLKDAQGNPTVIDIIPEDNIVIRYTFEYTVYRKPTPTTLTINGVEYSGTITLTSPNKWHYNIGLPVVGNNVTFGTRDYWTIDEDNYVTGGVVSDQVLLLDSYSNLDDVKIASFAGTVQLNQLNGTFGQIAFFTGAPSPNNMIALVNLEQDVVKTESQLVTLGIGLKQEANTTPQEV